MVRKEKKMAHRFGFINNEGELQGIISPGSNSQYTHLEVYPNGQTCVIIPENEDSNDIMSKKWYNLDTESWISRESRPDSYYKWVSGNWEVDYNSLFSEIRSQRNISLVNSDWSVLTDSPLTDSKKSEWIDYRQSLRDVPENNSGVTNIDQVTWPTPPQ